LLLDQKLYIDGHNYALKSTIDIGTAKSLVNDENMEGGNRCEKMHCIGHIPPEMWAYDPWLIMATKAQLAGDKGEYQKYVLKFFELHPALKIHNTAKYYAGVG